MHSSCLICLVLASIPATQCLTRSASKEASTSLVPQILHRVWTSDSTGMWQCVKIEPYIAAFHKSHPEWQMWFWNRTEVNSLVEKEAPGLAKVGLPNFVEAFHSLSWIKQSDTARYLVLYAHGGLYLDMDISCKVSVDPLFSSGRSLYVRDHCKNNMIAAAPREPFFVELLINIMKDQKTIEATGVDQIPVVHTGEKQICGLLAKKGIFGFLDLGKRKEATDSRVGWLGNNVIQNTGNFGEDTSGGKARCLHHRFGAWTHDKEKHQKRSLTEFEQCHKIILKYSVHGPKLRQLAFLRKPNITGITMDDSRLPIK